MQKLSIIVPVYFNESNLPITIPTLQSVLTELPDMEGEMIFVDDGSGDRSYTILCDFASKDPRIKVIRLAKNFGAHTALLAGLDVATGDCMTFIMADMQDPPELIKQMVNFWKKGSKIVLAERIDREDAWIDRAFANVFWHFMHRFASRTIPKGGFDFVLFDKAVAGILTATREKNSHIMTQILWTGFPPQIIPYTRIKRRAGKSKWTFSKKLKLFIDSAIAFSYFPIRIMSFVGIFTAILGFMYALYVAFTRIVQGEPVQGWTSLVVIVLILGGLQMIMTGIVGEYLWRTYDEARNRPSYVIAEKINFLES